MSSNRPDRVQAVWDALRSQSIEPLGQVDDITAEERHAGELLMATELDATRTQRALRAARNAYLVAHGVQHEDQLSTAEREEFAALTAEDLGAGGHLEG